MAKLFNYRREGGAARTLRVLRQRWPDTKFDLVMRSDWRFYIHATTEGGKAGYVERKPLASIALPVAK